MMKTSTPSSSSKRGFVHAHGRHIVILDGQVEERVTSGGKRPDACCRSPCSSRDANDLVTARESPGDVLDQERLPRARHTTDRVHALRTLQDPVDDGPLAVRQYGPCQKARELRPKIHVLLLAVTVHRRLHVCQNANASDRGPWLMPSSEVDNSSNSCVRYCSSYKWARAYSSSLACISSMSLKMPRMMHS